MKCRAAAAALVLLLGLAAPGAAATVSGGFVTRALGDTIALERYTIEPGRATSAMRFRLAGLRFDVDAALTPEATVSRMGVRVRPASAPLGTPPTQSVEMEWRGDSVFADVKPGRYERHASVPGAMPYVNPSMFTLELLLRRALSAQPPLDSVPMFAVTGGRTLTVRLQRGGADTLRVFMGVVEFVLRVAPDGRVLSGAVPAQNVTIERVAGIPEALLAEAPRDDAPPQGAPYTTEQVQVPTRGGFKLAGTLTWPRVAGRQPCVLMITGSGPQDRDESLPLLPGYRPFRQIADTLARRGIATLRLDDRGTGASGGRFAGSTSLDFTDDAEDAIRWLQGVRDIDTARIAVLGHSEGGLIAPLLAQRQPRLRALVLLAAPAWNGRRIMEFQNAYAARQKYGGAAYDSVMRVALRAVDSLSAAEPWTGFFARHEPLAVARTLKRPPVLVMQGATDQQVAPEQARELAEAFRIAGNDSVALVTLPATNHLFLPDPVGDPGAYARLPSRDLPANTLGFIADWLSLQFFPRPVVKNRVKTERERERELERELERERRKKK